MTNTYLREIVVSQHRYSRVSECKMLPSKDFLNLKVGEKVRIVEKGTGNFMKCCLHAFIGDYVYWN
jgi:hypothetical protein